MTSVLMMLIGSGLILFVLFDAFVTILSLRGGGPATTFISRKVWRMMLTVHRRIPLHRVLAVSGPVLLILIVIMWYALLYLGWFLVFNSSAISVVDSTTSQAANQLQTWYFTGTTISGLGYGDYTAREFPWTVYSTLAVFTGTLLTSLALSYIIAVVPVALEKRQLANQINAVIPNFDVMRQAATNEANAEFIWRQLFDIQLGGTSFSNKYSAYPVVAYFHSSERDSTFSLAYLKCSDALFYFANCQDVAIDLPPQAVHTLKHTITMHVANLRHVLGERDHDERAHHERFPPLEGCETLEAGTGFGWSEYRELRKMLVIACIYDGW